MTALMLRAFLNITREAMISILQALIKSAIAFAQKNKRMQVDGAPSAKPNETSASKLEIPWDDARTALFANQVRL